MKTNRTKIIVGKVVLALISVGLVAGSFGMMFGSADTSAELALLGSTVNPWLPWLGLVKFTTGLCLWVPRLRRVAVLVLTGYLGGAMMAGIILGEGPWGGAIFLALLWLAIEMITGDLIKIGKII